MLVVMEDGFPQSAPREVFEQPTSEFVARFIGGHNVLPSNGGMIAVRADRCVLGEANGHPHVTGRGFNNRESGTGLPGFLAPPQWQ